MRWRCWVPGLGTLLRRLRRRCARESRTPNELWPGCEQRSSGRARQPGKPSRRDLPPSRSWSWAMWDCRSVPPRRQIMRLPLGSPRRARRIPNPRPHRSPHHDRSNGSMPRRSTLLPTQKRNWIATRARGSATIRRGSRTRNIPRPESAPALSAPPGTRPARALKPAPGFAKATPAHSPAVPPTR